MEEQTLVNNRNAIKHLKVQLRVTNDIDVEYLRKFYRNLELNFVNIQDDKEIYSDGLTIIKLFQEKRKKFNSREVWYWYKKILEILRANTGFWNQLNEGTRGTIDAWIKMIGDMISHQDKQSSESSHDKSSASKWTESKDDSRSQDSEKNSQDTHDDKAIEIHSSPESDDKVIVVVVENKDSNPEPENKEAAISKNNENKQESQPEKERAKKPDYPKNTTDIESPKVISKQYEAKKQDENPKSIIYQPEETKGNPNDEPKEEQKINIVKSSYIGTESEDCWISKVENQISSTIHKAVDHKSPIERQQLQSFIYPETKIEINEKIYLAGCYSSEDLNKCLSLIDHRELDVYKKDQKERQMWSELTGDNICAFDRQMDVDTVSSDEERKSQDQEMVDIEEIVNQSSDDESIIGRTPHIPDPVKRQRIWESILSSMPDVDNDSFDDEDELVFAVKINELINPEYVEFTRTKRVKILKPLLQKKRDAKDFVKELEEEMMGTKKLKSNHEQYKYGNSSNDPHSKTSLSEYFKNRQMQTQKQVQSIKQDADEANSIKSKLNAIKSYNTQDKTSKPYWAIGETNRKLNPIQNPARRGLQASIERHKLQSSITQPSRLANSISNFQKSNEPKIVELEDNDEDDVEIIESDWAVKKKADWVKIEDTKPSLLPRQHENKVNEGKSHIEQIRSLINASRWNIQANREIKSSLNHPSSSIKEEAKRYDTHENQKFGLAAKLERIKQMHQNAKREQIHDERRINLDSDSSGKNIDSNQENDGKSDDQSNSLFSSDSSDEDGNARSRSKSIDINDNSYEEESNLNSSRKEASYQASQLRSSSSNRTIQNYFKPSEYIQNVTTRRQISQSDEPKNTYLMDAKSKLKNLLSSSGQRKAPAPIQRNQNGIKSFGWQDKPLEIDDDDSDEVQEVKNFSDRKVKQAKLVIQNDRVKISGKKIDEDSWSQLHSFGQRQEGFQYHDSENEENHLKNQDFYEDCKSREKKGNFTI